MLQKRSEEILNAVIESFIKTGSPVSSGWLYEKYDFGIKPAMIRHELENLTETGYLDQPYHSAGRVPSDKAYEIFVSQILETNDESSGEEAFIHALKDRSWSEFLSAFSSHLGILGALEKEKEDRLYKTGLEALLDRLDWEDQTKIKSIIRDFEELDEKVQNLNTKLKNENLPQVFIGRKSPITESEDLAVVAQQCILNGEKVLLIAIGPKRMNYKKVVKTFKGINNIHDRR